MAKMSGKDRFGNDIHSKEERPEARRQNQLMKLNDLPAEVIVEIFGNLELVQLNSLRLVCRYWNQIVSDKTIWEKSFRNKFGNEEVFPSFAHTNNWIIEYLSRLNNLKRWKKSIAKHINYQIVNEVYLGDNEYSLADFASDKLLTYCKINNNITICSLHNGRNQTFIPGNNYTINSYGINWRFLVFSTTEGGLFIKNLITSTSTGSRSSVTEVISNLQGSTNNELINRIDLNLTFDKHKQRADIVTSSTLGIIRLYNLSGSLLHLLQVNRPIVTLKANFQSEIVVITRGIIYIIDFNTFEVIHQVSEELLATIDYKPIIDYDFEYGNIIINYLDRVRVISYHNQGESEGSIRELNLSKLIKLGKLQQVSPNKPSSKNNNFIGKDGLFYANVLEDNEVIIWNVREAEKQIKIRCKFYSDFKYKQMSSIIQDETGINAMTLNSSVIVLGGYNGYCNIHDIFTGKFLRESSVKFPKKFSYMFQYKIPVREILLNEYCYKTNGVIMCGDLIQYFQFGDINDMTSLGENGNNNQEKRKKLNVVDNNKKNTKKSIKDQLDDYDLEEYQNHQLGEMFDKYNGADLTSEDELTMAIALSESSHTKSAEDEELEKILELSRQQVEPPQEPQEPRREPQVAQSQIESQLHLQPEMAAKNQEEEELRRVMELSLIDQ